MSVDKSNTKYYDVVIKWLNIITLTVSIDKRYTLYRDVVIKWLNIVTLTVNIDKIHTLVLDNNKLIKHYYFNRCRQLLTQFYYYH